MKLTKLTPHIIQGFYNDLLANGRIVPKRDKQGKIIKKDGVAVTETAPLNAKTVRNVHGVLTKALSQAVKVGYIARNPCDMVDLPRVEKAQIMPLTDEQVKSFEKILSPASLPEPMSMCHTRSQAGRLLPPALQAVPALCTQSADCYSKSDSPRSPPPD